MHKLSLSFAAGTILLSSIFTTTLTFADSKQSMAEMRAKWVQNFIPAEDTPLALVENYTLKLDQSALALWKSKGNEVEALWPNLVLDNQSQAGLNVIGAKLNSIYSNLFTLTKAWATPGTSVYQNSDVLDFVLGALSDLNSEYYNDKLSEHGNWWHWELGMPPIINDTLLILGNAAPTELVTSYNRATKHFVSSPDRIQNHKSTATGGNLTDAARVVYGRGLLGNNEAEIKQAVAALPSVFKTVTRNDGFYADGSFIQHGDIPYIGTYGQVLLSGISLIKQNIAGTEWDFDAKTDELLYQTLEDAYLPVMYEGKISDVFNGRAISRKSYAQDRLSGADAIKSLAMLMPGAPEETKTLLKQFLKAQLTPLTVEYLQSQIPNNFNAWVTINQIINDQTIALPDIKLGAKNYASADRIVYQGNNWFAALAMNSKRVGNYECMNGENLKGQRTSDGMLLINLPGEDQYVNYWPAVDPTKLPSITAVASLGQCDEQYIGNHFKRASNNWAGGVTLGEWLNASHNLQVSKSGLSAKKSWFMTPNMIINLGTSIKARSEAITTIANRRVASDASVSADSNRLTLGQSQTGVNEIALAGKHPFIWKALGDNKASAAFTTRKGDWSDIGTYEGEVEESFLTITQSHNGNANSYAWAIFPNQNEAPIEQIELLANNDNIQAVKLKDANIIYANFWFPSEIAGFKATTPLAMIVKQSSDETEISVSSPKHDKSVALQLASPVSIAEDTQNRVSLNDKTVKVNLDGLNGNSYSFKLHPVHK